MYRWIIAAAICWMTCAGGAAQQGQSGSLPNAPSANTQSQTTPSEINPQQNGMAFFQILEQKSRVFPDLATNRGRLNSWDKFKLAANNSVALPTIGAALLGSAFSQAIDSASGYGQGADGYAKRFGADMARSASNQLFGTFLIASATHEDPRFYVKRHLSFGNTLKYAAVRLVIARSDSGTPMTDYAGLLGPLAGEALANSYYAKENRGAGATFIRYSSDEGTRFAGNVLRQYWPRINKKLRLMPSDATTTP